MAGCDRCIHLHFGVLDQPDNEEDYFDSRVSRPIEFDDFEYSYDGSKWTLATGVPEAGMFVRRRQGKTRYQPQLRPKTRRTLPTPAQAGKLKSWK